MQIMIKLKTCCYSVNYNLFYICNLAKIIDMGSKRDISYDTIVKNLHLLLFYLSYKLDKFKLLAFLQQDSNPCMESSFS